MTSSVNRQNSNLGSFRVISTAGIDPAASGLDAPCGTIGIKFTDPVGIWQKKDNGFSVNWTSLLGSAFREIFFQPQFGNQVNQRYRTRTIGGSGAFEFTFVVPQDFGTLISLEAICIPTGGADGPARSIDLNSEYALVGEAINTNAESDSLLLNLTGTADTVYTYDVSSVFSSLAANHSCGLEIDHNGIGGGIDYLGLRMRYNIA